MGVIQSLMEEEDHVIECLLVLKVVQALRKLHLFYKARRHAHKALKLEKNSAIAKFK